MTSQKTGGCKCGGKCGKAKKDCTCGTKKAPVVTNPTTVAPVDQTTPATPVTPPAAATVEVKKAGCGCAH